jgi:hypothetical protein
VCVLVLSAAAAVAQNPPSYDDANSLYDEPVVGEHVPDTDYTPRYDTDKGGEEIWRQVEGSKFRDANRPEDAESTVGSVTRYEDNLFDVSLRNDERGLAGGARCANPDPDVDLGKPEEAGCTPVVFEFRDTVETGPVWSEVGLPGADQPGFVGAIAWIGPTRAMVVGGTGIYPRREPSYDEACQDKMTLVGDETGPVEPWGVKCDPAGMARVWLYDDGDWCEMQIDGEQDGCPALPKDDPATARPEGMRGLTAVDFQPGGEPELGFAAGLGQIWKFKGGRFDKLIDNHSPPADLSHTSGTPSSRKFRFRVRDLKFVPQKVSRAFAVTSGCCTPHDASDEPAVLTYSDGVAPCCSAPAYSDFWGITNAGPGSAAPGQLPSTKAGGAHQSGAYAPPRPDSFYSLTAAAQDSGTLGALSVLATHASSDSTIEPRSETNSCNQNVSPGGANSGYGGALLRPLGAARLLGIDGETPAAPSAVCKRVGPDWAVGELRTAFAAGRGRRGLVLSTEANGRQRPAPYYPPPTTPDGLGGSYTATDEARIREAYAGRDQLVSSYTLNSVDIVGGSGAGWAVGDHGAMLKLDSSGDAAALAKAEPDPPSLRPEDTPLGAREPFDALRPVTVAGPGEVPPLATRSLERLAGPRLVSWGSPDATHAPRENIETEDVGEIVMSRDGSDGWAVGSNVQVGNTISDTRHYGRVSLYRFDGAKWTRCEVKGIPGLVEADPACAGLAPFVDFKSTDSRNRGGVKLTAAVRVPFENDPRPGNDDEFEIVAITTHYLHPGDTVALPALARLERGSWAIDTGLHDLIAQLGVPGNVELVDVAFTAPDDGWVLARLAQGQGSEYSLFHFDGTNWSKCDAAGCGGARVPTRSSQATVLGLEAVGDRVYMYGWRVLQATPTGVGDLGTSDDTNQPLILYRDRTKGVWTDGSGADEEGGGYDPGFVAPGAPPKAPEEQGKVVALSVAQRDDGTYAGWAVGRFFDYAWPPEQRVVSQGFRQNDQGAGGGLEPTAIAMRLEQRDGRGSWGYFKDPGALSDFMGPAVQAIDNARMQTRPQLMATLPDGRALVAQRVSGMLFGFEPGPGRFEVIAGQRPGLYESPGKGVSFTGRLDGEYQAVAPDGRGGFWAAVKSGDWRGEQQGWPERGQVYFFHHTAQPHSPVFREVAQPLAGAPERFTALAGAADGSVWAGTDAGRLARYDRLTGWEALSIQGWEPGAVTTRRSPVTAVAVGEAGSGVAVGPGGRIADLSSTGVRIDPATGVRCGAESQGPCGTGYDLRAAAAAPDGSALVGGDALTVLWRPAGGDFRRVGRPAGNPSSRITGISYPNPGRAYLVTDAGNAYAGERSGDGWAWGRPENVNADGDGLSDDGQDHDLALRAIAIDAEGDGYAVGDRGLLLERRGSHGRPWRRLVGPGTDDLRSVALGPTGEAALVGGEGGVIWTRAGHRFEIARPADYSRDGAIDKQWPDYFQRSQRGAVTGAIVGVVLLPGVDGDQVEAWAASEAPGDGADGTNRLFHYASDPDEPLLSPDGRARPLPDAPAARAGEIGFAAFGNTDCDWREPCFARRGMLTRHELIGDRVVAELRERLGKAGGPEFSLFTGDATFTAGLPASSTHRSDRIGSTGLNATPPIGAIAKTDPYGVSEEALGPVMQRQWNRTIADPLEASGLPLFGAVGAGDLSRPAYNCAAGCTSLGEEAKTGDNLSWRDAMAVRRAPWGTAPPAPPNDGELSFIAVPGSQDGSTEVAEQRVDPDGDGPVPEHKVGGGARTHYAVDVLRGDERVARIVVVDTSLRSLQGSDPVQQPVEPDGQLQWLERMVCREGERTATGEPCSLGKDQQSIVLTNTPTYSYGATLPTEINVRDGAQFEALLIEHKASVVVSGRLGWNARYWATAPGVHEPCPGGAYQDAAPAAGTRACGRSETDQVTGQLPAGSEGLAPVLGGLGAPLAPSLPEDVTDGATGDAPGVLPFVISGGGGGPLGTSNPEEDRQTASDGYWNGYTIVRLDPAGDPRGVIVEQRPIFDWIHLAAQTHVLRPGQKMTLKGVGREPVGYGAKVLTRFDELNTAAITHRYDLVMADPEKPYLPLEDANGDYVPVPPQVASVDRSTGALRTGRGRSERTYTIAILSVGDKAATWPIAFEPRRSFVAQRAKVTLPALPRAARAPAAQPPVRLTDTPPPPAPPPATPPGSPLTSQSLQLPEPPALPSLPSVNAAGPPAPPSLNAPPPPPPPPPPPTVPPQQQPQPLALGAKLQAVAIVPSVNPPAPPPVNPAPPGGAAARKEAKQRQAATAKSEEGSSEGAGEAGENRGDQAPGPSGTGNAAMTRRERDRPASSFTALPRPDQASTWARGALYGGGLGLAALAFSAAWLIPRPRRRTPRVPAPALQRARRR